MLGLIKAAFQDFKDDDAPRLAAALSYYTIFSLPPLLILLMMIAGALFDPQDIQQVSIAALIFGATGAFGQLQAALNKAWDVEKDPEKSGLVTLALRRLLSFGMILVIAFLLLVSMVLSTVLGAAGSAVADALPGALGPTALWVVDIGLSLLVITLLFMAMYRVLPDAEVAWRDPAGRRRGPDRVAGRPARDARCMALAGLLGASASRDAGE